MNELYLWSVTALTGAVAVNTIIKLWTERDRLWRDDLHDDDRLFAWRIVLFLVFPAMTLVDLRATLVTCQWFGGYIKDWTYGLFWYTAVPQGVPAEHLLTVLFAGVAMQLILSMCLLPSLFFRPHPFLATIIGYTIVTVVGLNVVVDPILSLVGMGGSRWQQTLVALPSEQRLAIFSAYGVMALLYFAVLFSEKTRLWFTDLSRPLVSEELRDALAQAKIDPKNMHVSSRLTLLYERAGLNRQAANRYRKMKSSSPTSIYTWFVNGILSYKQRKYKTAREAFLQTADFPHIDPQTRGSLLAAAGCAAFAENDLEGALNLSERALEFDDASLVARMVKVDVFLRTDRKEQAGEEIIAAIRRGLDLDLESKVPLDADRVLQKIARAQTAERRPQTMARL